MPTLILNRRAPDLSELMDDPACDRRMLDRTFAQFSTLNRLLAGWGRIWRRYLRGALGRPGASLLDIGCGGGDVIRYLADLAERDGLDVRFTGIDPDERAIEFARSFAWPGVRQSARPESDSRTLSTARPPARSNIRYCNEGSGDFVARGERFDAVISNHVLHHLDAEQFDRLLTDSLELSRGPVVHNDVRRDDLAPLLFRPAGLLFRDSFIVPDGLTSIRRSYTADELRRAAGPGWSVRRQFPFRLLLMREAAG